jgi:hypothetical protein
MRRTAANEANMRMRSAPWKSDPHLAMKHSDSASPARRTEAVIQLCRLRAPPIEPVPAHNASSNGCLVTANGFDKKNGFDKGRVGSGPFIPFRW